MRLRCLHESYLNLLTARQADRELKEAIEAAFHQILDKYPVVREDHELEQELLKAITRMHEQRDDLMDTDPFTYVFGRLEEIVKQKA